jgi:hypothetical protein
MAFLSWVVAVAFHFAGPVFAGTSDASEGGKQATQDERGRISGVVLEAATGEPIVGAYVGVGDFGDSSGTNYSRHRKKGLFAKAKTDEQGRFVLDGIACQDHPLVVTHPEFVRHDLTITLRKGVPGPDVKVALRSAAKIDVTVVDSSGKPLDGIWHIRLEAPNGRRFIPPGRDPHLSTFASSVWVERPRRSLTSTGFSFTGLDSGEYSIDVMKYARIDSAAPAPAGKARMPLDTSNVVYYGSIAKLRVEAGQAEEVRVKPTEDRTSVTIKVPQGPAKMKDMQIPSFVIISRNVGLLLWNDGKAHHPEDHRLGRLEKNALYWNAVVDSDVFKIKNLPPGSYSVFAGPVYFMSAAKMEVSSGREVTVDLPSIMPTERAKVNLRTCDRRIRLEDKGYSVSQLCELVSAKTDSNPRIVADPSIENERLELGNQEATIWELMEEIYLGKGWKLAEQGGRTLLLGPNQ